MVQSAAQICSTARNIAKCPGYYAQSGQALNEALAFVNETQQFDYARGFFQFTFNLGLTGNTPAAPGCGPYPMPLDWLRADFREVWFDDQGVPHQLMSIDPYQYDMEVQQAGLQSYPTVYTTLLEGTPATPGAPPSGPPVMYVWSPPQSAYVVNVRYRRAMPAIISAETSPDFPWFPYTQWLVEKTSANLMRITDDTRWAEFEMKAEKTMNAILKLANDNTGRAKTVKLDPRRYGNDYSGLPNTKEIWIGGAQF